MCRCSLTRAAPAARCAVADQARRLEVDQNAPPAMGLPAGRCQAPALSSQVGRGAAVGQGQAAARLPVGSVDGSTQHHSLRARSAAPCCCRLTTVLACPTQRECGQEEVRRAREGGPAGVRAAGHLAGRLGRGTGARQGGIPVAHGPSERNTTPTDEVERFDGPAQHDCQQQWRRRRRCRRQQQT